MPFRPWNWNRQPWQSPPGKPPPAPTAKPPPGPTGAPGTPGGGPPQSVLMFPGGQFEAPEGSAWGKSNIEPGITEQREKEWREMWAAGGPSKAGWKPFQPGYGQISQQNQAPTETEWKDLTPEQQARRRIGGYLARGIERQFGRTETAVPQGAQQRIMQRLSEGAQARQPFGPKQPARAPGGMVTFS